MTTRTSIARHRALRFNRVELLPRYTPEQIEAHQTMLIQGHASNSKLCSRCSIVEGSQKPQTSFGLSRRYPCWDTGSPTLQ